MGAHFFSPLFKFILLQREELRARFPGVPGDLVNFFLYVAEEVIHVPFLSEICLPSLCLDLICSLLTWNVLLIVTTMVKARSTFFYRFVNVLFLILAR
jgi:hypothetical protein